MNNISPFPSRIYHILILVAIGLFVSFIPIYLIENCGFLNDSITQNGQLQDTVILLFFCLSFIVATFVINKIRHTRIATKFNFKINLMDVKNVALIILFLLMLQLLFLFPLRNILFGIPSVSSNSSYVRLLYVIVITPFLEELIFRMIILGGLSNRYNSTLCIFISSLLFMLGHPYDSYISTFIIGLFLGIVYCKKKNIIVCILIHTTLNATNTIIMSRFYYFNSIELCWALLITFIVAGSVAILYWRKTLIVELMDLMGLK